MSDKHIQYTPGLPAENIYEIKCPIIYALDIIGQKWKLPIMWYLFGKETTRYNELKRSVTGITNIMLTKSLRELEEHRLVHRFQHNSVPPKVEYSLTERGKALLPTLNELYTWGEEQYNIDHADPLTSQVKCTGK